MRRQWPSPLASAATRCTSITPAPFGLLGQRPFAAGRPAQLAAPPVNSSRPYLLRALYEWIVDNGCTPHIIVDAQTPGVDVPEQYVKDGQIVLNLSPSAVIELQLADDCVSFNGRFGGKPTDVFIPLRAVLGVYARENGQGMAFEPDQDGDDPAPRNGGKAPTPLRRAGKPSLKVVK